MASFHEFRNNHTVVIRKADGAFCGFCGLQEFLKTETPELSIELMSEFHHQGIGTAVVPMLMKHYADKVGTHVFHAYVSPSNLPSQGLMRKLGAIPHGVKPHPAINEEIAQMMEELDSPQPENIRELAEEFHSTPRQLRSHVLVFQFDVK